MINLQNIVGPEQDICSEEELYYQGGDGVAFCEKTNIFQMDMGATLSFETYFNLFNLGRWKSGCDLSDLSFEIVGRGRFHLKIILNKPGATAATVLEKKLTLALNQTQLFNLSDVAQHEETGLLHLELQALDAKAVFLRGRFVSSTRVTQLPQLAISITTFLRESEVQKTVQRLERFLEHFEFAKNIQVQVVDNGHTVQIPPSDQTAVYLNRNLGGAGGFSRGLLEAEAAGSTHCLFMDDDATFHMENIVRTYAFLALAKDSSTALAGAMINTTNKWAMWENGAYFDGACSPLHSGTDLRSRLEVAQMELFPDQDHKTLYGGWWFFAFPIREVKHYPFPFFVRGDDVGFSIANDFRIFTLNGVVSFQEDFSEKESPLTLYLDLRNHLMHHLVFDDLARNRFGFSKIILHFLARSLLRFHYSSARAQLLACRDILQGPGFFDDHLDMTLRRAQIKELSRDEDWQAPSQVDQFEHPGVFSRLPERVLFYLGLLTLNGHIIPFWSSLAGQRRVGIQDRGTIPQAFGYQQITYFNAAETKVYTVAQSKLRFVRIAWQTSKVLMRFFQRYRGLKASYRADYGRMTSKHYWQKVLQKS